MMKNKLLFLVSGDGGLLRFIYHCIKQNILPQHEIVSVVADRECGALQFAQKHDINNEIVCYSKANRIDLLRKMESVEFDIAITTIYKILDEAIIGCFTDKLINVHPSALPAFKGFRAVEDALDSHVKFLGTTVHHVNEEMDGGRIIAQSMTPVDCNVSRAAIMDSQFRAWCLNLLNVLLRRTGEFSPDATDRYRETAFNPPLCFDTTCFDENFWSRIKHGASNDNTLQPPQPCRV